MQSSFSARLRGLSRRYQTLSIVLVCLAVSGCATLAENNIANPPANKALESTSAEEQALQSFIQNARALFASGEQRTALMALENAKSQNPTAPAIGIALGELYQALGDTKRSREEFEAILIRNPDNPEALQALGLLHLKSGNVLVAKQVFRRIVYLDQMRVHELNPLQKVDKQSPALAYNSLGVISDYEGDHNAAAEYFLMALQITKSPYLYNNLGYSRYLAENFGSAEWAYNQALRLDPEYGPTIRNMALLVASEGNPERARDLLDEQGDQIALYHELGRQAVLVNDQQNALNFFARAKEIAGNEDPFAENQLAKLKNFAEQNAKPKREIKFVNTNFLRVRDSHSTSSNIVGYLQMGTPVEVIEANGDWFYVKFAVQVGNDQTSGWVYGKLLRDEAG